MSRVRGGREWVERPLRESPHAWKSDGRVHLMEHTRRGFIALIKIFHSTLIIKRDIEMFCSIRGSSISSTSIASHASHSNLPLL